MSEKLRAAAQAALTALDEAAAYCSWPSRDEIVGKYCREAAAALRAALAEAAADQVARIPATYSSADCVWDDINIERVLTEAISTGRWVPSTPQPAQQPLTDEQITAALGYPADSLPPMVFFHIWRTAERHFGIGAKP